MTTGPAVTPQTEPDEVPTVAIPVLLLDHKPPTTVSDNVVHAPTHTLDTPRIGPGEGLTFTVVVTKQLVGNVYFIVVDKPFVTPVTVVDELGPAVHVAASGLLLVHVPPGVPSVNVIVWPTHTDDGPDIGAADGELTVTTTVEAQPVPSA